MARRAAATVVHWAAIRLFAGPKGVPLGHTVILLRCLDTTCCFAAKPMRLRMSFESLKLTSRRSRGTGISDLWPVDRRWHRSEPAGTSSHLKISLNPLRYKRRDQVMRKLILSAFIAVGALIGLFSAAQDGWGTRIVMMGVGVLFAAPIGAVFAGIRRKASDESSWPEELSPGSPSSSAELLKNYWRDEGHPPFMKPSDAPHGRHQFDADRLR